MRESEANSARASPEDEDVRTQGARGVARSARGDAGDEGRGEVRHTLPSTEPVLPGGNTTTLGGWRQRVGSWTLPRRPSGMSASANGGRHEYVAL